MDAPEPFQFLSISRLWPENVAPPRLSGLYSPNPPPMMRLRELLRPTPEAVLQLCVRGLRLFRDCAWPHIRDVRIPEAHQPQRDVPCQDRAALTGQIVTQL